MSSLVRPKRDQPTGRSASATFAFWSHGNQPGSSSPQLELPVASSVPESRECPPGSSSPTSPRAPPECSVSWNDAPSTSDAPAAVADSAAGPDAAAAATDDDVAWIPSSAYAPGIRESWPGSSSLQYSPSSRRSPPEKSATWREF